MSEHAKIKPSHLSRFAIVYVRQSSAAQVEHNRESTARQYGLTQRAAALGWSADRVTVIDEDLGLSGATTHQRSGFARMTAEVALSHVGIILGLYIPIAAVAVGTGITSRPPRRSRRAAFPHRAPPGSTT
jgi:hypothetical protein